MTYQGGQGRGLHRDVGLNEDTGPVILFLTGAHTLTLRQAGGGVGLLGYGAQRDVAVVTFVVVVAVLR